MNKYFEEEMKALLKDEYEAFVKTQEMPMYKALRINTAKTDVAELKENGIELGEVTPFNKDTYYLSEDTKLGNHPFHNGGLYYLQEPSATMVVTALDVKPGDMVMDLCAAPGGKSTQILTALNGEGFLVSNEISSSRAQKLLSNIERWSFDNFMITNMDTATLCPKFAGVFNKIVVDAPCSGASMFKKYPESVDDYTEGNVKACASRSLDILKNAYLSLKQAGTLVYSTCTYNLNEDEMVIDNFLKTYPDMELVDCNLDGIRHGYDYGLCKGELVRRVFPMDKGEGHFVAKMIKHAETKESKLNYQRPAKNKIVDEFIKQHCLRSFVYTVVNDKVYLGNLLEFKGKVVRNGVLIGELVKNRLEPHQHFFTCLAMMDNFKNVYNIDSMQQATAFMKGNSLNVTGYKGYVQIRYKNHPIGFGKGDNLIIKNHYPKGLRIM